MIIFLHIKQQVLIKVKYGINGNLEKYDSHKGKQY